MRYFSCLLLYLLFMPLPAEALVKITSSDVYKQVTEVHHEVHSIRNYFKIKDHIETPEVYMNLQLRNVWQKGYEILFKINLLRKKHGLPRIAEIGLEPVRHLEPGLVYEVVQRIFVELEIFKFRLNIPTIERPRSTEEDPGKDQKPIDVFNALNHISDELDQIIGTSLTPSAVFAQGMRILEDVNVILDFLNIYDDTEPPDKRLNAQPIDVFRQSFSVLHEIQRLQSSVHMEKVNFSPLLNSTAESADVFNMLVMLLAELQPMKASLGLNHFVTPPAAYYTDKSSADVYQLLGWIQRKLKRIRALEFN
ncbi:hypothetical protein ACQZV8_02230 [Magnetococcales bacterium HHB-1]